MNNINFNNYVDNVLDAIKFEKQITTADGRPQTGKHKILSPQNSNDTYVKIGNFLINNKNLLNTETKNKFKEVIDKKIEILSAKPSLSTKFLNWFRSLVNLSPLKETQVKEAQLEGLRALKQVLENIKPEPANKSSPVRIPHLFPTKVGEQALLGSQTGSLEGSRLAQKPQQEAVAKRESKKADDANVSSKKTQTKIDEQALLGSQTGALEGGSLAQEPQQEAVVKRESKKVDDATVSSKNTQTQVGEQALLGSQVKPFEGVNLDQKPQLNEQQEAVVQELLEIAQREPEKMDDENFHSKKTQEFDEILNKFSAQELIDILPAALAKIPPDLDNKTSEFIIQRLLKKYPEISDYFVLVKRSIIQEDRFVDIEEYKIIKPDGIRVIVDYLEKKGALKFPCKVVDNIKDFEGELDKIKDAPVGTKQAFIVRCQGDKMSVIVSPTTNHVTPIYLERTQEGWKILETDAAGDPSSIRAFYAIRDKIPSAVYYSGGNGRQKDGTNCPIFALRDLVEIGKHPDIFNYLESQESVQAQLAEKNKVKGHQFVTIGLEVGNLPPGMLKATQSISTIQDYLAKKTTEDTTTLQKSLKSHTFKAVINNETKDVNSLVSDQFRKYQGIIAAYALYQRE